MNNSNVVDIRPFNSNALNQLIQDVPVTERHRPLKRAEVLKNLTPMLEYALGMIVGSYNVNDNPDSEVTVGTRLIAIITRQLKEAV